MQSEAQTASQIIIECGILGKWCIMVSGDAYPAREVLKQYGFRWVPEWKMWVLMFRYKREWETWIRRHLKDLANKLSEYREVKIREFCKEAMGEQ